MKEVAKKIFSVESGVNHQIFQVMGLKFKIRRNKMRYLKDCDKVHLPYVETHVVDHCNLNCRGCTHFCPVTPETFIDIKDFERDILELSKKCNITEIRLLGGEPLLHPDICEFIKVTKKAFPISNVFLLTNGILLKKMTPEFWETLRENDVTIEMTHYPAVKNIEDCLDLIKQNKIKLGSVHDVDNFMLMLNPKGDSNIKASYKYCPNKNCINFHNGKLVYCPIACYMYRYNEYFKTNLPQEEGIEVSSSSAKAILNYLRKPPKTCQYCTKTSDVKLVPWSVSKKQAEEWYAS